MNTSVVRAPLAGSTSSRSRRVFNPAWFLVSPSVALLLLWMIVPLAMTLYCEVPYGAKRYLNLDVAHCHLFDDNGLAVSSAVSRAA